MADQDDELPGSKVLDAKEIERLMKESSKEHQQDAEDRRCKRGKYAPAPGVCRVCGGVVTGKIKFDHDGRIGGPPVAGHVGSWSCDSCFLVYAQRPEPQKEGL